MAKNNVLVIGDSHLPFEHRDYLNFCCTIRDRCKCTNIVHIGDLVDNHSISYHEHDPDGMSPEDELNETINRLKLWFKEFPNIKLCRGNHDCLVDRKGKTAGLPSRVFLPFRDIWGLPKGWVDEFEFYIDGVRYLHGTGYSGRYGHVQAAIDSRCSTVTGHLHSSCGVEWSANERDRIFAMGVGCGIDRKLYAHAYGKDFRRKPILAVGVVTDKGAHAQVLPMSL